MPVSLSNTYISAIWQLPSVTKLHYTFPFSFFELSYIIPLVLIQNVMKYRVDFQLRKLSESNEANKNPNSISKSLC